MLKDEPTGQTVYAYGTAGHNVLGEYRQAAGAGAVQSTEHIYLPTASGPMPVATVINGQHFAVHADHLNTPRRLTDIASRVRWQRAYSGYGDDPPQALALPSVANVAYNLRFPGQVDDGNGLFYNWHRFYHPASGRYVSADPIGLEGGWNRFAYVGGNPVSFVDPKGLQANRPQWWNDMWKPITPPGNCATPECAAGTLPTIPPIKLSPEACFATCFAAKTGGGLLIGGGVGKLATMVGPTTGAIVNGVMNSEISILGSELMGIEYCYKKCDFKPREICSDDQLSNVVAP